MHMPKATVCLILMCCGALLVAGCSEERPTGPPSDWQAVDGRWWKDDVDTSRAFQDMESLEDMQIDRPDEVYSGGGGLAPQQEAATAQLTRSVQEELLAFYRKKPEAIDSLFSEYVQPMIAEEVQNGRVDRSDPDGEVDRLRDEGYETLREHFRGAQSTLDLGSDVPVHYPDSLRDQGVGGRVEMQVYINAEGEPVAVRLLEGVHPALNESAMRAATQMRWQPAYLLEGNSWEPTSSWVRYTVSFTG